MEELAGALAAGLFPGKQRIGVDRSAVPPALARSHLVDREMEVRARRVGIAAMADAADHLAAPHLLPLVQSSRVGGEVRVIIDPLPVGRAIVDGDPAA